MAFAPSWPRTCAGCRDLTGRGDREPGRGLPREADGRARASRARARHPRRNGGRGGRPRDRRPRGSGGPRAGGARGRIDPGRRLGRGRHGQRGRPGARLRPHGPRARAGWLGERPRPGAQDPDGPRRALRTTLTGAERPIDLGELGGRLFVSVAGLGLDAAVAAGFNARGAGRRGVWPYIRLALEALTTTPARSYTLEVDGVRRDTRALLVACANGPQYGSGARIAPQARLDDGWLDLVVVEDRPALARLAAGGRLFTGTLASAPGVWTAAFTRLEVTAAPPLAFHVDGEVVQSGPHLVARVHPGALRVRGGALLADRSRAGVSRPRVSPWR